MNVIIVNDYAHINGGAARVAIDSAVGLAQDGVHVAYFSAVGPIETVLEKNGVKVTCIGQYDILTNPNRVQAVLSGIWNLRAARMMDALLRQYSPAETLVHVHGWSKALSSSPIRVAIKRGFRVVVTAHDYFLACPNGGFYNYQENKICHLTPLSTACTFTHCDKQNYSQKVWRVFRQVVQQWLGRFPGDVKYFITLSVFSEQILSPFLPVGARNFRLLNPISVEKELPVAVLENTQFAYLGRVSIEKGIELFARAATELNLDAVCIGDGPDRNRIEKEYPSLKYTGWLSSNQLYQFLKKVRCLVFPSLLYEVSPLAIPEAAAMGIPAIVSDQSAARSDVVDRVTGLWFSGGDLEDLKNKIKQCQSSSEQVASLGLAAYQKFWANPPTLDAHIDALRDIYLRILSEA